MLSVVPKLPPALFVEPNSTDFPKAGRLLDPLETEPNPKVPAVVGVEKVAPKPPLDDNPEDPCPKPLVPIPPLGVDPENPPPNPPLPDPALLVPNPVFTVVVPKAEPPPKPPAPDWNPVPVILPPIPPDDIPKPLLVDSAPKPLLLSVDPNADETDPKAFDPVDAPNTADPDPNVGFPGLPKVVPEL